MTDADRWQHCITHGFPARMQNPPESGPTWMAFGPGNIRAAGHTPNEAVDSAILQTRSAA